MLVNGAKLMAHHSGAVFWPDQSLLLVADLHLEKGSSWAKAGHFLPPYDTAATLRRLTTVIEEFDPTTVACLGDSFHDFEAEARLNSADTTTIQTLTSSREWLWVGGNHDPLPPAHLGGQGVRELILEQLQLRHVASGEVAGEVAGHLHPKASIKTRGRRMTRRCFVSDGVRLILPAFGAYAGGLDVFNPAFAATFPGPFMVYLLGRNSVHAFSSSRIVGASGEEGYFHRLG